LRTFTKSGHEVHILTPQLIKCTPQNSGLIEDILIGVHSYLAKEEQDKKADRIRKVCARMRSEADTIPYTSIAPAWLKPIHDKKLKTKRGTPKTIGFEVVKERMEIVKQIFKDAANGLGIYIITKRLNESKTPCFGKSKVWNTEYVGDILRNRAVLGEWQPHRTEWEEHSNRKIKKRIPEGKPKLRYYPRIISPKLFDAVRGGIDQRQKVGRGRKGENLNNLFAGIARCAYCNSKMGFQSKGHGFNYLFCNDGRHGLGCKITTGYPYKEFETSCLKYFRELDLPSIIKSGEQEQKRAKKQQELDASDGRIAQIEKKARAAAELLGEKPNEILRQTFDELEAELKAEKSNREITKRELASLTTQSVDFREFQDIIKKLQSTNGGEDVYRLRAQVASKLKSVADKLVIASNGSAPFKKFKSWFVVGEKRGTAKRNPKIDFKNHPGMQLPWFAIYLRDVKEQRFTGFLGTVVVPEKFPFL